MDHIILIYFSQAYHHGGGNHIGDHLLGGTCLHAGTAADDLGSYYGGDGYLCHGSHLAVPVAGYGYAESLVIIGVFQSGQGIGGPAAGSDADDAVLFCEIHLCQIFNGQLAGILSALHSTVHGFFASGQQTQYPIRGDTVCGQQFNGIQSSHSSGSTGAAVDDPSSGAESFGNGIYRPGNHGQLRLHCRGNLFIFFIDQCHDSQGIHLIDMLGGLVHVFRGQAVYFYHVIFLPAVFISAVNGSKCQWRLI